MVSKTWYHFTLIYLGSRIIAAEPPRLGTAFKNVQGTFWSTSAWIQDCSFQHWPQPADLPPVAVAKNLYLGAGYCGACVAISAANSRAPPKRGIINTKCVDCPNNALDISPPLWNAVTPKNTRGVIPGKGSIDWTVVPCNFTSDMLLINKEGSSINWFAMQAANSNAPVKSLVVRSAVGLPWLPTTRQDYNFFTRDGLNKSPTVDVEVTCTNGKKVMARNVPLECGIPNNGEILHLVKWVRDLEREHESTH
ncbi:hypothetical protein O181_070822 [Austropuccinia psidii MF-1]|uniref:Expansin-like EG45 domain-containing protein n=1 Tax=Austropuccinia psidii MF-1 TaxID=1389203 RepID=A0A9Q3F6N5_9BASI|nr:hypothetical protein [Austropuccinia psidii MF-1]